MTQERNPDVHPWLRIDADSVARDIAWKLRDNITRVLSKRGAVVAVSGGIDSSVCAALATKALGPERVLGLLLPETDSSAGSRRLGEEVCRKIGIPFEVHDIAPALSAFGCYRLRDEAVGRLFPEYGKGWKFKIVLARNRFDDDRLNFFRLVVESPSGERMERRLPHAEYLQIVAATNFKQRVRKTLEYFHADRLQYAVVGTPNRLEYDQGFFVKNGDGAADVKPIAHLYKTQVYQLGRSLSLPEEVLSASPSTDTYSLEQGQDEFFFVLPYHVLDLVLYGVNSGRPVREIAEAAGLTPDQVRRAINDIRAKRKTTQPQHLSPILLEPVPEVVAA